MCLFSIVIKIFNDSEEASKREKCIWSIFYSSPFEIEARQRTLPERVVVQKETNWSLFNPILPKIIEKQYKSKNDDGNIQTIGSDIDGMVMYLRSPQIRNKVFHPVFLMMKFRDSIHLYYNKNLVNIQQGGNIFAQLQIRIFETLWNHEKPVFLNENKLFILTLKRKDYNTALSKNEKQIIKHLKSLNGLIVNFMITDQKNIPKNFTEMIYDEKYIKEYREGFLEMSLIDFKRTKMDQNEKNLLMEFDAETKQNYDYNNGQQNSSKNNNQKFFAQTTISINHKYCLNRSERKLIKCSQKDNQSDKPQSYFSREFQQNENSNENNKRSFFQMIDQTKEQFNINDDQQQIDQMRKHQKKNDDIVSKININFTQNLNSQELNDNDNKYDSQYPKCNESQLDSDKQKIKDISSDSDKTQSKKTQYDSDLSKINEIQSDSDRTKINQEQFYHEQIKHKEYKHSSLQKFKKHEENKKKVIMDDEIVKQNTSQKIDINHQSLKIIQQNEQELKIESIKQEQSQLAPIEILHINNQHISKQNTFIQDVQQLQQQNQQYLLQQKQEYFQQQQLQQQQQQSHEKQQQQSKKQLQFQQNQQNPDQQKQHQNNEDKQNKADTDEKNKNQNNQPFMLYMGAPQLYLFNNQGTNSYQQQPNFIYPNQSDNFGYLPNFIYNYMQFQQMQNDNYCQNVIQKQQQQIMDQQKIIDEQHMKKK